MTKQNIAASVRQRLLNKSKEQQEGFDLVLVRYALERLLYRIAMSPHRDRFVLKGAMLFPLWSDQTHRPTRDMDLLGTGSPSLEDFERIFREACEQRVDDDGLQFLPSSVAAQRIKEEEEYEGLRLKLEARLASARIPLQVDIGFGDVITPGPSETSYPTILDFPAPKLMVYPRETVVAEKYQAMVALGIANSRMKDFFDLWVLCSRFEFPGKTLCSAIRATFDRRKTKIPTITPLALTPEFTESPQKQTQWQAFIRKNKLDSDGLQLSDVGIALAAFLIPPTRSIADELDFDFHWSPGKKWSALP